MADRLELLQSFVEKNPDQPFARYGLAMEYLKRADFEQAEAAFRALLERNPDYPAGYYQLGRLLEQRGRTDEARATLRRGLEACRASGDHKLYSETAAALFALGG
jgi:tetratricopeptide (TPR) repeat protein